MVSVSNTGLTPININVTEGMDLETMMMAVQSNRASLLESQLKTQVEGVQAKNKQIADLNKAMACMNSIEAKFPSGAKAEDSVDNYVKADDYALEKELNTLLATAGSRPFDMNKSGRTEAWHETNNPSSTQDTFKKDGTIDKKAAILPGGLHGGTTKGELSAAIQTIKSQIDNLSNSQQMDMLRLQSLSNKRNEAFDLMTNFIKKMQDSRSSIVGNMR